MAYIAGAVMDQAMLLPARVEDYVGADAMVRVIAAFVDGLDVAKLGFERCAPAETGRPGYDPRVMLRLYIYGYLNGPRSSRRLERECRVNVELLWLMAKLAPDFKTIADFRRDNAAGITGACKAFVLFCREVGLIASASVAIDGTKLRAAASRRRVMDKGEIAEAMRKLDAAIAAFLTEMDERDATEAAPHDETRTKAALEKLRARRAQLAELADAMAREGRSLGVQGEPEARPMGHGAQAKRPAYNVQIAVETEHHIIVHHAVTTDANDAAQLAPMALATKDVMGAQTLGVVADAGYANAAQAAACENANIEPAVPAPPPANNTGDYYDADQFVHDPATDTLTCPAGRKLRRNGMHKPDQTRRYRAENCADCPLKQNCTTAARRYVYKSIFEAERKRAAARADKAAMRLRRSTVEHPFADLKRRLGGRLLLRGWEKAATETALGVLAYNLTRVTNILGVKDLIEKLA